MKTFSILAIILITTSAYAVDTPMQCNLTCKTDKSVMYTDGQPKVNDLIAAQNSSTGGFDFVTECLKYQGKIWEWREGKCKSMSPDWKSPGIGNTIQQ